MTAVRKRGYPDNNFQHWLNNPRIEGDLTVTGAVTSATVNAQATIADFTTTTITALGADFDVGALVLLSDVITVLDTVEARINALETKVNAVITRLAAVGVKGNVLLSELELAGVLASS